MCRLYVQMFYQTLASFLGISPLEYDPEHGYVVPNSSYQTNQECKVESITGVLFISL